VRMLLVASWTFFIKVTSHCTNSLAGVNTLSDVEVAVGIGRAENIFSAEARFLPIITMSLSPLVCSAKTRTIPSPIPDVPPTKTATGCAECEKAALEVRIAASDGMVIWCQW